MRIGLAQYKFINKDISHNLSQIEKAVKAYAGKVDLLCFGESFLQGFDSLSWNYDTDKDIAVTMDSSEIDKICGWSKEYQVAVLFGYFEKDGDAIYSSCALADEGKIIHNYRRRSIGWKEYSLTDNHYQEGSDILSFSYGGLNFEIALCGDLWDTNYEAYKTESIVLWPVYVSFSAEDWKEEEHEYAAQAAKIASNVLMVNSLSDEPVSHGGTFYFKDGHIIQKLPYGTEDVLIIDI